MMSSSFEGGCLLIKMSSDNDVKYVSTAHCLVIKTYWKLSKLICKKAITHIHIQVDVETVQKKIVFEKNSKKVFD